MRKCGTAVAGIVLLLLCVVALSGSVALVRTHGNSMAPRITTGDLVIVAERSTYHPGDVVAYHSRDLQEVVLHRIKLIQGNRYTFRGDHNEYDDAERPEAGQLIGREVIHIPRGGVWLDRLDSPPTLGLLAFVLVAGGGTAAHKRRKRRKRPMAQHARPATSSGWLAGTSRTSAAVALFAAVVSLTGIALSVVAWTTPTTQPRSALVGSESRFTFSYRAEVPRSPAYEGTTVTAPDPLFRSLVHTVQLSYAYTGRPGTIRLDAELSSASGWHRQIPLLRTARFDDARSRGHVDLDLDDLSHRSAAAAAAIGMPVDQVSVAVVATIRAADGETFAPRLTFALTPTALRLASEKPQLEFRDRAASAFGAAKANTIEIVGRSVEVSALRVGAGAALALALSVLAMVVLAGHHRRSGDAGTTPRKYRDLLLEIEPIIGSPGRPIIDVADLAALAKLAERLGVLVMHWTRSNVQTFVVHDDGMVYRHRVQCRPRGAPRESVSRRER